MRVYINRCALPALCTTVPHGTHFLVARGRHGLIKYARGRFQISQSLFTLRIEYVKTSGGKKKTKKKTHIANNAET